MDESAHHPTPHVWAWTFVLVLLLVSMWRWFVSGLPGGGDWAQYLSHALALAEGRPYGDIGYLYSPYEWTVGPPRYPPGLPLTLAPLFAVFGPGTVLPRLMMHGFLLALVLLVGRYFSRDHGPTLGWATAGLLAASFLLADRPNVVGSDLGFCALVWGAVVLADQPDRWSWGRTLGIAALGGAAISFRLAGAALVPAVLIYGFARRRTHGRQALLTAAVWFAAFLAVQHWFGLGERFNAGDTASSAAGGVTGLTAEVEWLASRLGRKFVVYRQALSETLLYPFPLKVGNQVYHVVGLLAVVLGLVRWVRRSSFNFGLSFALMTLVMLASVRVWTPRYLWVLSPFVCYGLLAGLQGALRWVATTRVRPAPPAGVPGTRAVAGFSLGLVLCATLTAALWGPPPAAEADADDWATVATFLRGLPDSANVAVASDRPRKTTWFTRTPAMPLSRMTLESFLAEANRYALTHAVMTGVPQFRRESESWIAWSQAYPGLMRLLLTAGPLSVYQLDLSAVQASARTP